MQPLLHHFGDGGVRVALCDDGSRPLAAAMLRRDGTGRWTTWQPSQLPLGAWMVARGEDSVALAHRLLAQLPGWALGLGLTQLDPRFQPRPEDAATLQTLDYIDTAWVDVDGDFHTYWEARGKNLRTNMRKQRSKLESEGIVLQFDTLTAAADMPAALADYGRLESAGWKAGGGTAVHPDNAQGRFYAEMMQAFCTQGRGRVWRLRFGDKVVAMDLCIEGGDTLVVLKTAFDPEYRNVSPAFLLKQDAFGQVFDQGRIRRLEFYGRLMEWHTRWTEQSRHLYHANIYRWAWVPALRERMRQIARPRQAAEPVVQDKTQG
jgi:Acetyltransferase (GNAT) domain